MVGPSHAFYLVVCLWWVPHMCFIFKVFFVYGGSLKCFIFKVFLFMVGPSQVTCVLFLKSFLFMVGPSHVFYF